MAGGGTKLIVLRPQLLARVLNNNEKGMQPVCYLCKEAFVLHEEIVRKHAAVFTKWYHIKCAEKVNLI